VTFHSYDYLIFLPLVFFIYWQLPGKAQNVFLLIASYVFYGYVHPWFLCLVLASTILDYFCGLGIEKHQARKRLFVSMSLVGNLGLLGVFKYFNFFVENVQSLLSLTGLPSADLTLRIVLPAGISFYTFQTLSYTLDVYRGRCHARRNFIDFAVFVAFFPQLVAGPIERARRLIPQFERDRTLTPEAVRTGLCLILWGLYKKVVIADTVAIYCNKVFSLESPGFLILWAGAFAFYMQIYADFSAYSDIARGSARLLGFELMVNFHHPNISRSAEDLWRRWHISLTTWLRDYVTVSLHRVPWWKKHRTLNIFVTFLLCGLWHGASWNFVLWGGYCGLTFIGYPFLERLWKRLLKSPLLNSVANRLSVFVFMTIGFLIFREQDLTYLVRHFALNPFANSPIQVRAAVQIFLLTLIYSLPLWIHAFYDLACEKTGGWIQKGSALEYILQTALGVALLLGILVLHSSSKVDFIYFQF